MAPPDVWPERPFCLQSGTSVPFWGSHCGLLLTLAFSEASRAVTGAEGSNRALSLEARNRVTARPTVAGASEKNMLHLPKHVLGSVLSGAAAALGKAWPEGQMLASRPVTPEVTPPHQTAHHMSQCLAAVDRALSHMQ